MTRAFDTAAFVSKWRQLCAAHGVDPATGAIPGSSFDQCMTRAAIATATHHDRAAHAVYADAARNPDRVPDDKRDAPTFAQIASARASATWWDGVIVRQSERKQQEAADADIAEEQWRATELAKRQGVKPQEQRRDMTPKRPGFIPRVISSGGGAHMATERTARGVVVPLATWTALESIPTVRAARDEYEVAQMVNRRREGVYHEFPRARSAA